MVKRVFINPVGKELDGYEIFSLLYYNDEKLKGYINCSGSTPAEEQNEEERKAGKKFKIFITIGIQPEDVHIKALSKNQIHFFKTYMKKVYDRFIVD